MTDTGLHPLLGATGVARTHELLRRAARIASEAIEPSANTAAAPRTVDIIRRVQTAAGSTARGIAATWSTVAGLTDIEATLFLPSEWRDAQADPRGPKLKDGERMLILVDVPATGGYSADVVLDTDRIKIDDPVYGEVEFDVVDVAPHQGPGLVRVKVDYKRRESA